MDTLISNMCKIIIHIFFYSTLLTGVILVNSCRKNYGRNYTSQVFTIPDNNFGSNVPIVENNEPLDTLLEGNWISCDTIYNSYDAIIKIERLPKDTIKYSMAWFQSWEENDKYYVSLVEYNTIYPSIGKLRDVYFLTDRIKKKLSKKANKKSNTNYLVAFTINNFTLSGLYLEDDFFKGQILPRYIKKKNGKIARRYHVHSNTLSFKSSSSLRNFILARLDSLKNPVLAFDTDLIHPDREFRKVSNDFLKNTFVLDTVTYKKPRPSKREYEVYSELFGKSITTN